MKTKYKKIDMLLYNEDKCIKILNKMAKQGWIVSGFIGSFFVFDKQSPQEIYYQVDYNQYSDEYRDFVINMGYTFVGRYKDISIFYSHNNQAPDLQSDQTARYLALKRNYKIYSALLFILAGWIILAPFRVGILPLIPRMTWGHWLLSSGENILILLLFIAGVGCFFKGISSLLIRWNEKRSLANIKIDKVDLIIEIVLKIKSILFGILWVIGIPVVLLTLILEYETSIYFLLTLLIYLIIGLYKHFAVAKSKRETILKIGVLIGFLVNMYFIVLQIEDTPESKNNQSQFQTANVIESGIKKSIFYKEDWVNGMKEELNDDYVFYEHSYKCFNSWAANEIFKELLIETRREMEFPNEEELYELGNFNSNDVLYPTYDKVMNDFNEYLNIYVDRCYYFNNYVVAIKNNQVFASKITDFELIDQVLEYYFNVEEGEYET